MTNVLKRISILMVVLAMLLSCFAACNTTEEEETETEAETEEETVVYTLNLKADKTTATRGDSVKLDAFFTAEGKENEPSDDAEFTIVSGSEYASIAGNILKINTNAPDGASVTVQAKEGASYSNTVTVKISVPLKSITISAATDKPIAGASIELVSVLDPTDAPQTIKWVITEGADHAKMDGNVLMVNATATIGTVIKVKATSGDITSNELTFTVRSATEEVPAVSVAITAETMNPLVGTSVAITGTIAPANSTDAITYAITEGADFATLSGNVLVISANATAGVVIKVVATAGVAKSNELVFTVRDGSVAAESVEISANNLTPLAGQSVQISKLVKPQNSTDVVVWTILEGADKASMVGDVLVVNGDAKEGDVIKVQAKAGAVDSNVLEFVVSTTEVKATKVTISSAYLNLLAGQSMIIQGVIEPENSTEDITLYITEGAQYASIAGNVLVVSENAPANVTIKVIARAGSVNSNELVFTVRDTSKPAQNVSISSDNLAPIAGHSVEIKYTIDPVDTTDKLEWVILEGGDIAKMVGNALMINADAAKDSVIKVQAKVGEKESNILEFKVRPAVDEIKVQSIQLSAKTEVLRGETILINKKVNPNNANQPISWVFVEGAQYATITGDTIVISSDAKTGTKISVKAVAGEVESNVLTFTVQPSQEEINASKFYIDLNKDIFTLDKKGTSQAPTLTAEVYNYNYVPVTDKEIVFEVISGSQYLGITTNGANCSFTDLKGHGTAIVEIRIKGTDVVETAEINVIVPPDAVVLPEVFLERTDIEYSFSILDHNYGYTVRTDDTTKIVSWIDSNVGASKLPFNPSVRGTGLVCQDLKYNFIHESGKTGDEVAVYDYATNSISFKMTGKVTVTVSSASGSKVEATTSYKFNINEGYNVESFIELHQLVNSNEYTGNMPINIVVLEKPVGETCTVAGCYCGNKSHEYGYSLVPPAALKDHKNQTMYDIYKGHPYGEHNGIDSNRIQAVNKNFYLNGNNHAIDASQLRRFTQAEHDKYVNDYNGDAKATAHIGSLLSAEPWSWQGSSNTNVTKQNYEVKLYNVEVIGNSAIDYDPANYRAQNSDANSIGIYLSGINIGAASYDCHYYIDSDGLVASGFTNGVSLRGIVGNGKIKNIYAYNCFANGIMVKDSIVTLENLKFGACGATGMELAPEDSNKAGLNDNEIQQVTISGKIEASYLNGGETTYYQNYSIGGAPVPVIIKGLANNIITAAKGAVAQYGQSAQVGEYLGKQVVSHICNEEEKFIFVSLVFADTNSGAPNYSKVIYPNYQGDNGIITVEQLMTDVITAFLTSGGTVTYTDTTHQFIELPVVINGTSFGTALFYNQNYGK